MSNPDPARAVHAGAMLTYAPSLAVFGSFTSRGQQLEHGRRRRSNTAACIAATYAASLAAKSLRPRTRTFSGDSCRANAPYIMCQELAATPFK
jgi:hypothetical protein